MKDHRLIDERSLAFERLIAVKLRNDPTLLGKARGNLARWLETCSVGVRPALLEWQNLLSGPFDEPLAFMEATDERATRLRQSSPFCGILREFQARESTMA